MSYYLSKTLVLVGLMGTGKTAIGSLIADRIGVEFIDSDEQIVQAANMSIPEIFERDGEDFFRLKETQVIRRLLSAEPHVLSTGGGAFLSDENKKMIAKSGVSVWLDADFDTLWDRVKDKKTRPLLMVANPKEKLKELYEARNPEYAKAQVSVKALSNQTKEVMVERVIKRLLTDPNSGLMKVQSHA